LETQLKKNSTIICKQYDINTTNGNQFGSVYANLEVGDTITLNTTCPSGQAYDATIGNNDLGNFLQILKVGDIFTDMSYKVTYDGNGNTDGIVPIDNNGYKKGTTVTVLDNPGSLIKTDYELIGWNTQADGNGTTYTETQTFEIDNTNIILYAKWTKVYSLRDTGPAGGLIFYDKGDWVGGWRYLEAAPSDQSTGKLWSDVSETLIGTTGTGIGTGQANTTAIINQAGHTDSSAKLCNDLTVGAFSDWYLPSKDELGLMYANLKAYSVGGFVGNYYWSSSEIDNRDAWVQYFPNGSQDNDDKDNAYRVRAVRRF
jgi:hypothetical protein